MMLQNAPKKTVLPLNFLTQEESAFQSELSTMEIQEREQIMQITTSWEEKGEIKERL